MATSQPTRIETLLKLYAPKEVGVTLVPLQDVEQSEDTNFWASIFFALFLAFFGALLPLLFTKFDNCPVVIMTAALAVLFLILFICFVCKGKAIRRKMRGLAVGPESNSATDNEVDAGMAKAMKSFLSMSYALSRHVFNGAPTLLKTQFLKRVPQMFEHPITQEQVNEAFEDFLKVGMIEVFETDNQQLYVRPSLRALEDLGLQDAKLTINK